MDNQQDTHSKSASREQILTTTTHNLPQIITNTIVTTYGTPPIGILSGVTDSQKAILPTKQLASSIIAHTLVPKFNPSDFISYLWLSYSIHEILNIQCGLPKFTTYGTI